ncbi:large conductance mechanosensitive channel protein MscL [Luteipulveratus halotolerans]|uniref:Large-conductance mechanosensitive channel n=1 Tax=Luteipulveratus halotolerans TaxID=1631356 RepID=A0A0L6CJS8_9MICO|nr:large conductance mechanosensitive channel protein MscL [Luteipulveratus halotolerans]KNX38051.1 mechanosensitive ion channel protein MscL [Luteipulveratus halotolerans]
MKGFKDFIMRGNIVDLAVAVVIGTAFAKVVDTFVSAIIQPLINAMGSAKSAGLGFHIKSGQANTFINFSTIINALIVFLLTAAVVYFVIVLPMNKLNERRKRGQVEEVDPTELELLAEIRDELRARR